MALTAARDPSRPRTIQKMPSELRHVRQIKGEGLRRWFIDPYFDLIVWYEDNGSLMGFQLCYDQQGTGREFAWWKDYGFWHGTLGDGELPGRLKMCTTIEADDDFPSYAVAERFLRESAHIDPEIAILVFETVIGRGSCIEEAGYVD